MSQPSQRGPERDRDEDVPRGEDRARSGAPEDLTEPADRLPGESDAGAGPAAQDRGTPEPPD